jgi:hypothetical protein
MSTPTKDAPTAEELAGLGNDLAAVYAGTVGWGEAEARALKLLPRLARAYQALLAAADPYVFGEGKRAGKAEERAAIVAFLRAEATKFDKASHDRTLPEHSQERCSVRAALLETEIGYITRGDHEVPR